MRLRRTASPGRRLISYLDPHSGTGIDGWLESQYTTAVRQSLVSLQTRAFRPTTFEPRDTGQVDYRVPRYDSLGATAVSRLFERYGRRHRPLWVWPGPKDQDNAGTVSTGPGQIAGRSKQSVML